MLNHTVVRRPCKPIAVNHQHLGPVIILIFLEEIDMLNEILLVAKAKQGPNFFRSLLGLQRILTSESRRTFVFKLLKPLFNIIILQLVKLLVDVDFCYLIISAIFEVCQSQKL